MKYANLDKKLIKNPEKATEISIKMHSNVQKISSIFAQVGKLLYFCSGFLR